MKFGLLLVSLLSKKWSPFGLLFENLWSPRVLGTLIYASFRLWQTHSWPVLKLHNKFIVYSILYYWLPCYDSFLLVVQSIVYIDLHRKLSQKE